MPTYVERTTGCCAPFHSTKGEWFPSQFYRWSPLVLLHNCGELCDRGSMFIFTTLGSATFAIGAGNGPVFLRSSRHAKLQRSNRPTVRIRAGCLPRGSEASSGTIENQTQLARQYLGGGGDPQEGR